MQRFLFVLLILLSCHRSVTKTGCIDEDTKANNGKITLTTRPLNSGESAVIMGKILDEQKLPAPYMTIVIRQEGKTITGATTDENGHFMIKNVPSGDYEIYLNYIGYQPVSKKFTMTTTESVIVECELGETTIEVLKPVIYIYPESPCSVKVDLNYQGILSHSYPTYPTGGWRVYAQPDGTLYDSRNQEFYALFWEGRPYNLLEIENGFVISGAETAAFLEEKLAFLGLNRREANEFIMFWLPQLEENPYNLIHFSGEDYKQQASLKITPQPQTIIRVMMLSSPLQSKIDFPIQDLTSLHQVRKGYTVVEWGGSVVPQPDN